MQEDSTMRLSAVGIIITLVLGVLVAPLAVQAQQATTKDQLIGTWKVVTLKATSGDKVSHPLGEQVAGYVSFTPDRMWLLFVDSTRKAPAAAALTDAEAVAMMKSHVAWSGTYSTAEQTPDGLKVIARVDTASSQAITGSDRVYFMRVEGDKLRVKSPGVVVPMTGATSVVEFDLVKAE
jgi:lipocalin-like protein